MGPLCGDCAPGYVESLGSPYCRAVDRCEEDKRVMWPGIAVGLLVSAFMQLTFVSGVWLVGKGVPTAKMKVVIYFTQVRGNIVVVNWWCGVILV